MNEEARQVAEMLKPMFRRARAEKLWFFTGYQQMWFSPDELAAENSNGRLLWGPVNWELRDPLEGLKSLDRKVADAQVERDRFAARLRAA